MASLVHITDYSATLLKVNEDNSNIFFIEKDGCSVGGENGALTLTTAALKKTYPLSTVKSPSYNDLDDLVVAIRVFID